MIDDFENIDWEKASIACLIKCDKMLKSAIDKENFVIMEKKLLQIFQSEKNNEIFDRAEEK